MKQIKVDDIVYYGNDFSSVVKAKVLQLFTDRTHTGKPYPVALVVATEGKAVRHLIVDTQYLTTDSTEYDKQYKRDKILYKINQLQEELNQL